MNRHRRGGVAERGSELVEFAFVTTFFAGFMLWTASVGMNLTRALQVSQVSRDAGHLYARSVDFSDAANRQVIVRLAKGLNITDSGGSGVVMLSKILFIGQAQCDAAGLTGNRCTNRDQPVVVQRLTIGNARARASAFGTPPAELLDSHGNVSDYLTDIRTRATGFNAVLALTPGDMAFVSEVCIPSPALAVPGLSPSGVYARNVF